MAHLMRGGRYIPIRAFMVNLSWDEFELLKKRFGARSFKLVEGGFIGSKPKLQLDVETTPSIVPWYAFSE